jgi:hypothetical protein
MNTSGVVNFLLFCEPLRGQRWVDVTERRTRLDWAYQIRQLVDVRYPEAERIVPVLDNLDTHTLGALYDGFPPAEAKRLTDKLELHYTSTHGSWLTIAEIELSVVSRQCLDRRAPDAVSLATAVTAWQERRNPAPVEWGFTTHAARIKFERLSPPF